ncbi:MAG TPA: amidohydrolase family protein [Chloroflexota bacterium]
MPVIDADTHVDETEATWEFLQPHERALKPATQLPANPDPSRPPSRYWLIDGKRQLRFVRDDRTTGTTVQARELLDVEARLRQMDELEVKIQVMYPTLFLTEFTDKPELELALRRSYNRWLADRCGQSDGRLRWVCLPPTMSMDKALDELRFAKDHGACGVVKKGDREAGHWLNDEYFFPLYEEAQKLDMPLCFHLGSGTPDYSPAREFSASRYLRTRLPVLHGFHSLLTHGIPAMFPRLRFGFVETGASWVPAVLYDVRRTLRHAKETAGTSNISSASTSAELGDDAIRLNRMYFTCHSDEDLPYIMQTTGEDNLMMGSDYTHSDPGSEWQFERSLQARAAAGEIPPSAVGKLTYENAKRFYGL